jgi:hypothetical protein
MIPPIDGRWDNEPRPGRWFYVYATVDNVGARLMTDGCADPPARSDGEAWHYRGKFRLEGGSIRVVLPFRAEASR